MHDDRAAWRLAIASMGRLREGPPFLHGIENSPYGGSSDSCEVNNCPQYVAMMRSSPATAMSTPATIIRHSIGSLLPIRLPRSPRSRAAAIQIPAIKRSRNATLATVTLLSCEMARGYLTPRGAAFARRVLLLLRFDPSKYEPGGLELADARPQATAGGFWGRV